MYRHGLTRCHEGRHAHRLIGGYIAVAGTFHNQKAVLHIPHTSLMEIRPRTFYDLVLDRPVPVLAQGLPLSFKVIDNRTIESTQYTGFGITHFDGMGRETITEDVANDCGDHHGGCGCGEDDEVIDVNVTAEVFPVGLWGSGDQAFFDNLMIRGTNELQAVVRVYLNNKREFMIVGSPCGPRRRVRRVRLNEVMITREPIHSESIGITRSNRHFVPPYHNERTDLFAEGAFIGCGHSGLTGYGRRW